MGGLNGYAGLSFTIKHQTIKVFSNLCFIRNAALFPYFDPQKNNVLLLIMIRKKVGKTVIKHSKKLYTEILNLVFLRA